MSTAFFVKKNPGLPPGPAWGFHPQTSSSLRAYHSNLEL